MRRLKFIVFAVFAAASVVSFSTLSAEAQPVDQYGAADGGETSQDTPERTAAEAPDPGEASVSQGSVSQGSVSQGSSVKADSPQAIAAQKDLAVEENLPEYSQTVDNTTAGAFQAPGWKVQKGSLSHKDSYAVSGAGAKPARFKVDIPTSHDYSVYAWWPQAAGNGQASRFSVQAADGVKSDAVDQRNEGGMWIKIGSYAMEKGERYVQVAPGAGGEAVADAVMVVRGEMALPPEGFTAGSTEGRSATIDSRRGRFSGRDIVRQAKRHTGDKYSYATCKQTRKSCTCLTKMAVQPFGHRMGMTESGQWNYSRSRRIDKSRVRPGDEVFFKEGGGGITHVGIYSGNGNLVHASSYFGRVVNSEMRYVRGYFGAKRFK